MYLVGEEYWNRTIIVKSGRLEISTQRINGLHGKQINTHTQLLHRRKCTDQTRSGGRDEPQH